VTWLAKHEELALGRRLADAECSSDPDADGAARRGNAVPQAQAQSLELRPGIGEATLRPDQRGVVGRRDRLRALDDRDVLAHGQHGSTASNSAWATSPTASAMAWPTRAIAACANRALPGVPTCAIRADMAQPQQPHAARPELHVV
jgi:hypothetical protein